MSDEAIVAITAAVLTAIPPTLTAAAAFWQGRKNGAAALQLVKKSVALEEKSDKIVMQNDALEQKIVENSDNLSKQNDKIIKKSDEIHGLTNSNLERVSIELAEAHAEIKELRETIGKLASDGKEARQEVREQMKKDSKK